MQIQLTLFVIPAVIILLLFIYLQLLFTRKPFNADLTILITTINCANIVEGVIQKIIGFLQLYPWSEVVIVDRFSADETPQILSRLAHKYNFKYLQSGPDEVQAYNSGKKISSGKKIYLLNITEHTSLWGIKNMLTDIKKKK